MSKSLLTASAAIILSFASLRTLAWGKTGHEMTGTLASYFLDDSTRKVVQSYLGNLTFEEAANWMDDSRSNSYYNYMRTWHYIDMDKGEKYTPSTERNILTVLHSAILNLRNYKNIPKKDVKRDLLLIFHLVGDLHQPLHTGYAIDKGGNTIEVSGPFGSANLHSSWDTQILEYKGINADSCLQLYRSWDSTTTQSYLKIDALKWMYQSRSLLDNVYSFQNNVLDERYINSNIAIIKKQLLIAGIRIAAILNEVFKSK